MTARRQGHLDAVDADRLGPFERHHARLLKSARLDPTGRLGGHARIAQQSLGCFSLEQVSLRIDERLDVLTMHPQHDRGALATLLYLYVDLHARALVRAGRADRRGAERDETQKG